MDNSNNNSTNPPDTSATVGSTSPPPVSNAGFSFSSPQDPTGANLAAPPLNTMPPVTTFNPTGTNPTQVPSPTPDLNATPVPDDTTTNLPPVTLPNSPSQFDLNQPPSSILPNEPTIPPTMDTSTTSPPPPTPNLSASLQNNPFLSSPPPPSNLSGLSDSSLPAGPQAAPPSAMDQGLSAPSFSSPTPSEPQLPANPFSVTQDISQTPPNTSLADTNQPLDLSAYGIGGSPSTPQEQPVPTWSAPVSETPAQTEPIEPTTSSATTPTSENGPIDLTTPPQNGEAAPTDLSQLAESPTQPPPEIYNPTLSNNDSLVVPPEQKQTGIPETEAEPHKGIPKIAIIGAVVIILVVTAASLYFILGIGRGNETSTTTQNNTPPVTQELPTSSPISEPTPEPTPEPAETPLPSDASSSFGEINGDTGNTTGGSAFDLIKQRQQEK